MSNENTISVPYGNFSYEGINVSVDYKDGSVQEIPLTEEMISEVERMKFYKMGKQDVEVVYRRRYKTTMPINVVLNQFKDTYALNGYECVYDGLPHPVTLNQELPEGATIVYPTGNLFINAGTYEVVGVISKKGYESMTLTTTLTIHQAERDSSNIEFLDSTVVYNGELKSILATNVPEGVSVVYKTYDFDHNTEATAVNAGKYRVVASFVDVSTNYKKIPDREAVLTILKADYDVSKIAFKDVVKEYDGEKYVPAIENKNSLPFGISVEYYCLDEEGYRVTSNAEVGTYTMVAEFIGGDILNYNPIPNLEATLTVTKKVIKISDKVRFEEKNVDFDGEIHSLEVMFDGGKPADVEVTYDNNENIYAGEYEVTAHLTTTDPNSALDVSEMTAYLIINRVRRSVLVYNEETEKYDAEFSSKNISIENGQIVVSGYDKEVFEVVSATLSTIGDNVPVDDLSQLVSGDTYKYVIVFEYIDKNVNSSVILSDESDNYTYFAE